MMPPIDSLLTHEVGIFGAGQSGKAVLGLIRALGGDAVIYDENTASGAFLFSPDAAQKHSLIINSPGFPPHHPWFKIAADAHCQIMGEVEFANLYWPGKTYFVTGTNGKTTITQLLTAGLIELGYDAYAFGNIGVPFSEHYKYNPRENAVAVVEVSSFQAWNLSHCSVNGLIWPNFAEDHIDWHGEMERYFDAKWNALLRVADGPLILGREVANYARFYGYEMPSAAELIDNDQVRIDPDRAVSRINQINVQYVKRFVAALGHSPEKIDSVVENFAFLPHRLEFVCEILGVEFWNDSKATNFHSVEAALDSFYERVLWIGGGLDKSGNVEAFCAKISPKIKVAFTFGEMAATLSDSLIKQGVLTYQLDTLEEVFEMLRLEMHPGDSVIFSPGFASFDQYTGYADRGKRFKQLVSALDLSTTQQDPRPINN